MPRTTPAGASSGALLAALLFAAGAAAQETPFSATSRGAHCDLLPDGFLTCRYRVGRDLEFSLARIGEVDVRLDVVRSDAEGDYYLESNLQARCVLVRFGKRNLVAGGFDYAFAVVSGRNGTVYRSLRECRLGR